MPFQSLESKLFYTITIFSIIFYSLTLLAALPFLPIVTKISGWTRPDRQPCLSFSCYAPEHIYIWLYSDYSSNSCTILVLSPYYSPDKKGKRLPFSCYASIYSPARWALDGPTLTDNNQCYTTRNHKYFADKWLVIDKKASKAIVVDEKANSLDLFTKSLPQWLLKC